MHGFGKWHFRSRRVYGKNKKQKTKNGLVGCMVSENGISGLVGCTENKKNGLVWCMVSENGISGLVGCMKTKKMVSYGAWCLETAFHVSYSLQSIINMS